MKHLYFGDGKGKTTAAVGIAVRAGGSKPQGAVCAIFKNGIFG